MCPNEKQKTVKLTVVGESKKVKWKSVTGAAALEARGWQGRSQRCLLCPRLGARAALDNLSSHSTSICLRALHPGEAASTGPSYPAHAQERGCNAREARWACCLWGSPVVVAFIPREAALMEHFIWLFIWNWDAVMSRRLSRVGDRGEQMDPQKQKFIFRVIVFSD